MTSLLRIILVFGFIMINSNLVHAGIDSGGGSGCASSFVSIAKLIGQKYTSICSNSQEVECKYLAAYLNAVAMTTVTSEDIVEGPDSKSRDAINNGKDKITVHRLRWITTSSDQISAERWVRVIIHEYLSISKLEKSDTYLLSNIILNLLKESNLDLNQIAQNYFSAPKQEKTAAFTYKNIIKNNFSSVSIIEPKYIYKGEEYKIWSSNSSQELATRICNYFNYSKTLGFQTDPFPENNDPAVFLSNGTFIGIMHPLFGFIVDSLIENTVTDATVFISVTCQ